MAELEPIEGTSARISMSNLVAVSYAWVEPDADSAGQERLGV